MNECFSIPASSILNMIQESRDNEVGRITDIYISKAETIGLMECPVRTYYSY